jgi:EAL domain-containing protein (putative c-di-GMP-specific phosphodiesterase class I)
MASTHSIVLKQLRPFFQPIVSVSDGSIYGYEVLARQLDEAGQVQNIGPFFNDESVPEDERIAVDRTVRERAFQHLKEQQPGPNRLFINIHPAWIYRRREPNALFPTIQMMDDAGLAGENLIVEITEQKFLDADFDFLNGLIDRYRERGIKIAIDDFSFPNFDRLLSIKPDFVKVDIQLVKKSAQSQDYKKLVGYISKFCQELGISVIFEGVETLHELENAIESGGSLIQGWFLSKAAAEFQKTDSYKQLIQLGLNNVIYRSRHSSQNIVKIEHNMNQYLRLVIEREQLFRKSNLDEALNRILPFLPPQCFRVFICDGYGLQRSSNYTRLDNPSNNADFRIHPEHRGKNWGWRPYFFNNLVRMKEWERGVISHEYVDVETRRRTLTFSYPISGDLFIFLDFFAEG